LVRPVLHQAAVDRAVAVTGDAVQDRTVVRPEPREDRHVVRPAEDVDRVELEEAELLDQRGDLPDARRPRRPRSVEALSRKRDPPRPGEAQARAADRSGYLARPRFRRLRSAGLSLRGLALALDPGRASAPAAAAAARWRTGARRRASYQ